MSEDRYLNYGKLITDSHTGEVLITCKSNKNAEQITSLLNMQQAKINELEKENDELKKQLEDCKDYNSKIYANCLQKDRKWIKEVKRLEDELEECIKVNAKLREMYINDE